MVVVEDDLLAKRWIGGARGGLRGKTETGGGHIFFREISFSLGGKFWGYRKGEKRVAWEGIKGAEEGGAVDY